MILNVIATRDVKIAAYGRPIYVSDSPEVFVETLKRSIIGRPMQNLHLADCQVYLLGTFDDVTGKHSLLAEPEYIEDLHQFFPKDVEAVINGIENIKM